MAAAVCPEERELFVVDVLRCPDCGHDYTEEEEASREADEWFDCPGGFGRHTDPEPLTVNLLDEFVEARVELGAAAEMVVSRVPALGPRVEAQIEEVDRLAAVLLTGGA